MRIAQALLPSAILAAVVGAQDVGQPPAVATRQNTTVKGTVPGDLAGRWLALGWVELPGGQAKTTATLWSIAYEAGKPVLTMRFVGLPAAQQKAMDVQNDANKPWRPEPADLDAIVRGWDALPALDAKVAQVETEIVGNDAFDDSFKGEPKAKDAKWAVRQREDFDPSAAPTIRQVNLFAVLEERDGGYAGNYTTVTVAAAPFPIPIALNGTFQLHRLGGASSAGFLARLLDVFKGCGR